jgi:Phage protein Gp138 N-terminal domain
MPRRDVTLEEILDVTGFTILSNLYKISPGKVVAYYPPVEGVSPAMVDVSPAVNDVRFDTTDGTRISEPFPIIPKVPVVYPQGGGFSIVFPMKSGDKVTLLSYDLDPTKHRGTGNVEDPIDSGRHRGAYWVALPGDITDPGAGPDPGQSLVIGMPNGVTIKINASSITIGDLATSVEIGKAATSVTVGATPLPVATAASVAAIASALIGFCTLLLQQTPPGPSTDPVINPAATALNSAIAALSSNPELAIPTTVLKAQ